MQAAENKPIIIDVNAVRWYILQLPAWNKNINTDLEHLLTYCKRHSLPEFEYFAPTFHEVKNVKGKTVHTDKPLMLNYVFVRSSQTAIYRMMTDYGMSKYSFLPMVKDGNRSHFPYLTDKAMERLRWVARSYGNDIPVYVPSPRKLIEGDRIRITEGAFTGMEATVITSSGAAKHKVMARIDDILWVPLFEVKEGQFEIIELNKKGSHQYTKLSGNQIFDELDTLLCTSITSKLSTTQNERLYNIIKEYSNLQLDTDVLRSKQYAILLLAYTALGDTSRREQTIAEIRPFLNALSSDMSKALLIVTLYACTDSCIWYDQAHALVHSWQTEPTLKPAKRALIERVEKYDRMYNHERARD